MTTCTAVAPLMDDYLDDKLPPEQRTMVESHFADCPACRVEAETLRSILAGARALPRSVRPERDLWSGIAPRLSSPPVRDRATLESAPARPGSEGVLQGRFASLSRAHRLALQMAAVIGLILLGAALATAVSGRRAPTAFAADQARYNAASAALAEQLARERGDLSPDTRAVVQRNLAIIDAAIKEAEAALTVDPGNTALEQMLIARYEQRLSLLHRATASDRRVS